MDQKDSSSKKLVTLGNFVGVACVLAYLLYWFVFQVHITQTFSSEEYLKLEQTERMLAISDALEGKYGWNKYTPIAYTGLLGILGLAAWFAKRRNLSKGFLLGIAYAWITFVTQVMFYRPLIYFLIIPIGLVVGSVVCDRLGHMGLRREGLWLALISSIAYMIQALVMTNLQPIAFS